MTTGLKDFTGDVIGEPKMVDPDARTVGDDREEVREAIETSNCEGLEGRIMSAPAWAELSAFSVPADLREIVSRGDSSCREVVVTGVGSEIEVAIACWLGDRDVSAAS